MPLAKCARCEKLFDKVNSVVCPACTPAEEEDYDLVRKCMTEHPDITAEKIAEITAVDLSCVMRMIDQGMIANSQTLGTVKCGKCGAPAISASKRLCNACLEEMNRNLAKQRSHLQVAQRKQTQVGEYLSVREQLDDKRRS